MDTTHAIKLVETPGWVADRKPKDALRAFAQLLAQLAADRSLSDALRPDAGTDETVAATAGQAALYGAKKA